MCVFACMYLFVCLYLREHACESQRLKIGVYPDCCSPDFLRQDLSQDLGLTDLAGLSAH